MEFYYLESVFLVCKKREDGNKVSKVNIISGNVKSKSDYYLLKKLNLEQNLKTSMWWEGTDQYNS